MRGELDTFDADLFRRTIRAAFPTAERLEIAFSSGSVVANIQAVYNDTSVAADVATAVVDVPSLQKKWFADTAFVVVAVSPVQVTQVVQSSPPSFDVAWIGVGGAVFFFFLLCVGRFFYSRRRSKKESIEGVRLQVLTDRQLSRHITSRTDRRL